MPRRMDKTASAKDLQVSTALAQILYKWASSSNNDSVDLMILTQDAEFCNSDVLSQRQSRLMALPSELLLVINDFLDVPSSVCWTLTCKLAACAIGLKTWTALKCQVRYSHPENWFTQRWQLLCRLEPSLPDYHLCNVEKILRKNSATTHEWASKNGYNQSCVSRATRLDPSPAWHNWPSQRWFQPSFCEVQMVMNRHFYGITHGLPLNFLNATEDWQFAKTNRDPWGWRREEIPYFSKVNIVASIIDDQLQFHVCHRILVSPEEAHFLISQRETITRSWSRNVSPCLRIQACNHERLGFSDVDCRAIIDVIHLARSVPLIAVDSEFAIPQEDRFKCVTCKHCKTEARFTALDHEKAGIEFVVETWQNLGSGRKLSDPGWTKCIDGSVSYGGGLPPKSLKAWSGSAVDRKMGKRAEKAWTENRRKVLKRKKS